MLNLPPPPPPLSSLLCLLVHPALSSLTTLTSLYLFIVLSHIAILFPTLSSSVSLFFCYVSSCFPPPFFSHCLCHVSCPLLFPHHQLHHLLIRCLSTFPASSSLFILFLLPSLFYLLIFPFSLLCSSSSFSSFPPISLHPLTSCFLFCHPFFFTCLLFALNFSSLISYSCLLLLTLSPLVLSLFSFLSHLLFSLSSFIPFTVLSSPFSLFHLLCIPLSSASFLVLPHLHSFCSLHSSLFFLDLSLLF